MLVTATLIDILKVMNDLPDEEREQLAASYGGFDSLDISAKLSLLAGVKFAFHAAGEPYAVGGYTPYSRGVWQSWMIARNGLWENHGKAMTKAARRVGDSVFDEIDTRRLQTLCLASRAKARQWYRLLSLTEEGIMRKAGANGEDIAIFARIKE